MCMIVYQYLFGSHSIWQFLAIYHRLNDTFTLMNSWTFGYFRIFPWLTERQSSVVFHMLGRGFAWKTFARCIHRKVRLSHILCRYLSYQSQEQLRSNMDVAFQVSEAANASQYGQVQREPTGIKTNLLQVWFSLLWFNLLPKHCIQ